MGFCVSKKKIESHKTLWGIPCTTTCMVLLLLLLQMHTVCFLRKKKPTSKWTGLMEFCTLSDVNIRMYSEATNGFQQSYNNRIPKTMCFCIAAWWYLTIKIDYKWDWDPPSYMQYMPNAIATVYIQGDSSKWVYFHRHWQKWVWLVVRLNSFRVINLIFIQPSTIFFQPIFFFRWKFTKKFYS